MQSAFKTPSLASRPARVVDYSVLLAKSFCGDLSTSSFSRQRRGGLRVGSPWGSFSPGMPLLTTSEPSWRWSVRCIMTT